MAITGELVKLYHPDDKPEGVDKDSVALEVGAGYLEVVDEILAGLADDKKSEVVTDQFRRCCAELFIIVDEERKSQGYDAWSKNHQVIFVHEMYRTAKLYFGQTRKDGTSVFYSHLVGTVKNSIRDIGLTGIVSLLAMLKHDTVEDFVDKDELKQAGEAGALRRVKNIAALIRERIGEVRMEEQDRESLGLVVGEICGNFADVVRRVLSGEEIVAVPTGKDRAAIDRNVLGGIIATASKHANVVRLGDSQPDPKTPARDELDKEDREFKTYLRQTTTRFESYVNSVREAVSGKARSRKEDELYEGLLDISMYRDKVEGYDEFLARVMQEEVRELVSGLTKLRKRDRVRTLEATVAHHLSKVRTFPRAALLKTGGDRPHNTRTIKGHRPKKAEAIMEETELVYVPEADVFKIRRSLRCLVYDCVKFFNSDLLDRYDGTLKARLKSRLKKEFRDGILSCFAPFEPSEDMVPERFRDDLFGSVLGRVADVKFVPRGLDYYTRRAPRKSFAGLEFKDLAIDRFDPMFEILVTTKVNPARIDEVAWLEADIKKLRDDRAKVLRKVAKMRDKSGPLGDVAGSVEERLAQLEGLNYPQLQQLAGDIKTEADKKLSCVNNIKLASMRGAMAYIIDRFSEDGGYDVQLDATLRGQDDPNRIFGIILTIFNEKFGGQLHFRINDACAEARSKRGIIAETGNIPDDLTAMIGSALDRTVGRMQGVRGLAALKAEVFAPRITVKTLSGESMEFPLGATGFDFAARIHGDILIGAQRILEKDSVSSRVPAREVRFWDELKPGKVYVVESCRPDSKKVQAGLKWLLFTQSAGGNQLRRHFRQGLNLKDRLTMSRAYLAELSEIYNVDYPYIKNVLIGNYLKRFKKDSDYPRVAEGATPAAIERMRAEFIDTVLNNPTSDDANVIGARRRIWERILDAIGSGDINPVLALSKDCETNMRDWRRVLHEDEKFVEKQDGHRFDRFTAAKMLGNLNDAEKDSGKWEVDVQMPEKIGTLSDFAAEFSKEAGISIYHMKEHVIGELGGRGKRGKPGVLKLVFDLKASEVSQYEFFRKLLKLSFRYRIRVIDRMQTKYDKKDVHAIRMRGASLEPAATRVVGDGEGAAQPAGRSRRSGQLELFDKSGRPKKKR